MNRRQWDFYWSVALVVGVAWLAAGCETDPDRIDLAPPLKTVKTDALLAPGDQVSISIYRHSDLNLQFTVPAVGIIHHPLAGEFQVIGVTAASLRQELTERLDPFLVNPKVNVTVTARRSQKVIVLGEVRSPGVITMDNPMDAVEVVGRAGGFNVTATKAHVILIRREDGKSIRRVLDINQAITAGELAHSPQIQTGDILYVPPSTATNLDRFARHVSTWLSPFRVIQDAILSGYAIEDLIDDEGLGVITTTNFNINSNVPLVP